jgi:hypothetical protein
VIVPSNIEELSKTTTKEVVLLPWISSDMVQSNINKLDTNTIYVFYCKEPITYYSYAMSRVDLSNIEYTVVKTIGEYFGMYKAFDKVIFATPILTCLLDALYYKKPIQVLDNEQFVENMFGVNVDINVVANEHNNLLCDAVWNKSVADFGLSIRVEEKIEPEI